MRTAFATTLGVAAGLVAANMLGVADAEAPTTSATAVRTVNVQGVANVPIPQTANLATATSAYRQAMAAALSDGQSKAEFLASHAALGLGSVQNVLEDGGSISCRGTEGEGEELRYAQYEGEEPDFGYGPSAGVATAPAATAAPDRTTAKAPVVSRRKKRRHVKAKKAGVVSCTLSAQVSLVYAIAGS